MSIYNRVHDSNLDIFRHLKSTISIFPLNGSVYGFFPTLSWDYFQLYLAPWYTTDGNMYRIAGTMARASTEIHTCLRDNKWVLFSQKIAEQLPYYLKGAPGAEYTTINGNDARPVLVDDLLYSKKNVEEIERLEFIDDENFVCSTVVRL